MSCVSSFSHLKSLRKFTWNMTIMASLYRKWSLFTIKHAPPISSRKHTVRSMWGITCNTLRRTLWSVVIWYIGTMTVTPRLPMNWIQINRISPSRTGPMTIIHFRKTIISWPMPRHIKLFGNSDAEKHSTWYVVSWCALYNFKFTEIWKPVFHWKCCHFVTSSDQQSGANR